MHTSRMRTARSSGRPRGGVSTRHTSREQTLPRSRHPPEQTPPPRSRQPPGADTPPRADTLPC